MGRFLVVSKLEQLEEYRDISREYGVGFEVNDFFDPDVLDSPQRTEQIVAAYAKEGLPKGSTMHGAFLDVVVFSQDRFIREIARKRMRQSVEAAKKIGAKAVVFHTNSNPMLSCKEYDNRVVDMTADFLEQLLGEQPDIYIYLENMFDHTPDILKRISDRLSGYSNYGVCFDYAHASIYGVAMEQWVETLAEYVRHIHINDNDLQSDLHLAVGDGKLDWAAFERYYRQYFSSCSVLIETNSVENQRRSLEYLKHHTGLL
jgi:sugar phosphate isomerase/epimerase